MFFYWKKKKKKRGKITKQRNVKRWWRHRKHFQPLGTCPENNGKWLSLKFDNWSNIAEENLFVGKGRWVIYFSFLVENKGVKIYMYTSSPGKLRFARKRILGKWLYNVTKGVGCVCSVSKRYAGCLKVCGNDFLKGSVPSGYMVAECGVKPLSAITCLMKWGALQLPILSPSIL